MVEANMGSKKRQVSEMIKPQLLSHRFSSKSDLLTYFSEHRKYHASPNQSSL